MEGIHQLKRVGPAGRNRQGEDGERSQAANNRTVEKQHNASQQHHNYAGSQL